MRKGAMEPRLHTAAGGLPFGGRPQIAVSHHVQFQIEAFQRFDEQQRVLLRAETADKDDARFPTLLALERAEQPRVELVRNDRHARPGHALAADLLLPRTGRDAAMTDRKSFV